ncbi:MAG: GTP 3',8-cyclase MoaA [Actinomycetota bacterium]
MGDTTKGTSPATDAPLLDMLGRPIRDLRVSVTDRCNFRCVYCMPKEVFGPGYQFLKLQSLLTYEEITRLARIFAGLGVKKLRLTGGEPLVRKDVESLIRMLAEIPGLDLALTTNGSMLVQKAQKLKAAGLKRITVSLDSLDDTVFRSMNDVNFPVARVLAGIDAAAAAGLEPIKINMVVKRGVNESSILPMAHYFQEAGHVLRFIEYMDVGTTNGWRMDDVVPAAEIIEMINAELPLEPADPNYRGEVAARWRYRDGGGEIGVISSVTQPFCATCTRARLSSEGRLYTCLFATDSHDLRSLLRGGRSDEEIAEAVTSIWRRRTDRYSALRSSMTPGFAGERAEGDPALAGPEGAEGAGGPMRHKVEMSHIGG